MSKYEEALERARKYYKETTNSVYNYKDMLEQIFPDIEESEDKKIKEEIVNYFQCQSRDEPCRKHIHDKWIAWLEKQGEQKTAWSEEDEEMCQETIDWFEKKCFPYALENENPARESIKWLKSLKNRVLPQPKQEWSEEEQVSEEFINALGTMLNDGLPDRYLVSEERIKKSAELLFSIARKQLKNEMQEWSEEDEKIALSIEQVMNCASLLNIVPEKVDKIRTWLKFLKQRIGGKQ